MGPPPVGTASPYAAARATSRPEASSATSPSRRRPRTSTTPWTPPTATSTAATPASSTASPTTWRARRRCACDHGDPPSAVRVGGHPRQLPELADRTRRLRGASTPVSKLKPCGYLGRRGRSRGGLQAADKGPQAPGLTEHLDV